MKNWEKSQFSKLIVDQPYHNLRHFGDNTNIKYQVVGCNRNRKWFWLLPLLPKIENILIIALRIHDKYIVRLYIYIYVYITVGF